MGARALVVGAGSIGLRHRRVLDALGFRTVLVSRRSDALRATEGGVHADLSSALREVRPDHVVIATETTDHLGALQRLSDEGFTGTVLVEKPLTASGAGVSLETHPFRAVAVGYQLRFHPAVVAAREAINGARLVAVEASVGQHLADWRPGRDIGDTASARIEDGGGVLRDLSHELDLVLWIAGDWRRVCAVGGRSGALGASVDTDDRWGILLELQSGAIATVSLDALDRVGRRRLSLIAADLSVSADLVEGTVAQGGARERSIEHHEAGRDQVLADMHRALFAGVADDRLCSFDEGLAVVRLFDAVERSAHAGVWVEREAPR